VSAETAADVQACLDVIPPTASVAASQELLPHLSSRERIYGIPAEVGNHVYVNPTTLGVDYIAVDLASGGSPDTAMRAAVGSALAGDYGIVCSRQLTLVLQKGAPDKALNRQFEVWLAGGCSARACLSKS